MSELDEQYKKELLDIKGERCTLKSTIKAQETTIDGLNKQVKDKNEEIELLLKQ